MNPISRVIALASLFVATAPSPVHAAEPTRQENVRELSADVMPFDMAATTHIFTKSNTGGVQRVVAKDPGDTRQTPLIRSHLGKLADRFGRRDFSGPSHVRGNQMPGLEALRTAPPQDLRILYRDVPLGAEVEYASDRPEIVSALHQWFDAQLSDHGPDAMAGHDQSMHHPQ